MCCSSARAQRGIGEPFPFRYLSSPLPFHLIRPLTLPPVEECLKWVNQRKAFNKPLHAQAVIRNKLAGMIQRTESVQNWLENIPYQMCNMSYGQQASKLAG